MAKDPNFCTATFHEDLCVEFQVTFTVFSACAVRNVFCEAFESGSGPCTSD